jgi:hypothetical protein
MNLYIHTTAVAPGTVGTVQTVPLFLAGTTNRTTIWTEKNNFEMKKGTAYPSGAPESTPAGILMGCVLLDL